MTVRELLDELGCADADSMVFLRAPDGSLGEVQTIEHEVDVEDMDGDLVEAGVKPHVSGGWTVPRTTVFVIDGPVS